MLVVPLFMFIPLLTFQKVWNIFGPPLDFCLGFPLSKQPLRWDEIWDRRPLQLLPSLACPSRFSDDSMGSLPPHLCRISLLLRTRFFFDFDGMALCTLSLAANLCNIILEEVSLDQQSVHRAPQLWLEPAQNYSIRRNVLIYLDEQRRKIFLS